MRKGEEEGGGCVESARQSGTRCTDLSDDDFWGNAPWGLHGEYKVVCYSVKLNSVAPAFFPYTLPVVQMLSLLVTVGSVDDIGSSANRLTDREQSNLHIVQSLGLATTAVPSLLFPPMSSISKTCMGHISWKNKIRCGEGHALARIGGIFRMECKGLGSAVDMEKWFLPLAPLQELLWRVWAAWCPAGVCMKQWQQGWTSCDLSRIPSYSAPRTPCVGLRKE